MCGDLGTRLYLVVNLLLNFVKWAVRAWTEILQLLSGTGHRLPLPWYSREQAHEGKRDQNKQTQAGVAITACPL